MTTERHAAYERALDINDPLPVLAYGTAGTGKTYQAVGAAVEWLRSDKRKKVVAARPNVSFADGNGFLPGTNREKLGPWIRPIEQNLMFHGVKRGELEYWEKNGTLEYVALEHIQGLTFDDTFLIIDECQNMTMDQLRVFLTRTGKYSKVVMCGDVAQTSPKFKNSGLAEFIKMVETLDGPCHTIGFGPEDILRSKQAATWINMFDQWEQITHG